ncbi:hypothetical protein SAMN06264364_14513 [Quadrisphaera granulorum]|uniref:Uncharacterized protein n=1 Tax=Quadrisphaera granulorum TaxID=317664 RepID=A0A315ZPP4_9ACTN|nr:hypothetical protein [Quadrisphaera granulorum]PWJ46858.1 hypothetical protein BXY45_14513 [Quadrisphaera granulorum]SZE99025.1 hypothetical protein SAMN06264364_14513 [Quadrisphaera granulorum]
MNSLDQRGGVLLGSSGVLVAVTAQRVDELGWFAVVTGLLAALCALCSALEIRPRSSNAVNPRRLLEKWARGEPETVRLVILSTVADSYDREESAARQKGRLLTTAVVLLACAVGVLLSGVTVESGVLHHLASILRRAS